MNTDQLREWVYRYEPYERNFRPSETLESRIALLDEHLRPFERLDRAGAEKLFAKSRAEMTLLDNAWTRLRAAFALRGEFQRRLGRFEPAIASFEASVRLGSTWAYPDLCATIARDRGDVASALVLAREFWAAKHPCTEGVDEIRDRDMHLATGLCHVLAGQPEEALEHYSAARAKPVDLKKSELADQIRAELAHAAVAREPGAAAAAQAVVATLGKGGAPKKAKSGKAKAEKSSRATRAVGYAKVFAVPSTLEVTGSMKTSLTPGRWNALAFDWSKVKGETRRWLLEALGEGARRVSSGELVPFAILGGDGESSSLRTILDEQHDAVLCYDGDRNVVAFDEGTLSKWRAKVDTLEFTEK
jgi:hypothetical protein